MLASSPPPFYFSLPYEWLSDVPLVITLTQLFCNPSANPPLQAFQYERRTFSYPNCATSGGIRVERSQDGGGLERGRKVLKNLFAHIWHFWLVQHGDIDWLVWQVAIKILVQNNASVTYDQRDQSGGRRGSVNWCKLFFKGTSPDNSGNTLIYSFKNFFRLRTHAYSHIIHVT